MRRNFRQTEIAAMKIRLQKLFLPRHRRRRMDANAFCGVPCIFTTSCSFDSPPSCTLRGAHRSPTSYQRRFGQAAALDALGHRGRTGLAHKCLQTPLTFARSLIPLDLCSAAAHYKRATAAATCEYVCRRSYDKKGRDDCGPRSSPFRFTDSQIGGGGLTDRPLI